jgi:hypothetical protein
MANTPTANIGLNKPAQGDAPWDATMNANLDRLDSILSGGVAQPSPKLTTPTVNGIIPSYNGVPTVGNGFPQIVAKADAVAQAANIGTTTLYPVPVSGAGMYRFTNTINVTQAATTSSTLPAVQLRWTDGDASVAQVQNQQVTNSANTLGAIGISPASFTSVFYAAASTNIQYDTTGYASVGATVMQYAVHVKLEYLGN